MSRFHEGDRVRHGGRPARVMGVLEGDDGLIRYHVLYADFPCEYAGALLGRVLSDALCRVHGDDDRCDACPDSPHCGACAAETAAVDAMAAMETHAAFRAESD